MCHPGLLCSGLLAQFNRLLYPLRIPPLDHDSGATLRVLCGYHLPYTRARTFPEPSQNTLQEISSNLEIGREDSRKYEIYLRPFSAEHFNKTRGQ